MSNKRKNVFSFSSWQQYDYQHVMKQDKALQAPLKQDKALQAPLKQVKK